MSRFKAGFYNHMTLNFAGVVTKRDIPWLASFDTAQGYGVQVLIQDSGRACAGLYVNNKGRNQLALKYDDVCTLVSDSYQLTVLVGVGAQSYPSGTLVYKNGELTGELVTTQDDTAVWVIGSPTIGGGATAANLTATDLPNDLPSPAASDPEITLNNAAIPAGTIRYMTLRSIGGVNLGMVAVGLS